MTRASRKQRLASIERSMRREKLAANDPAVPVADRNRAARRIESLLRARAHLIHGARS